MADINDIRKRSGWLAKTTIDILSNILADVSQETATTYRDGGDGWTALEAVCHLRDFDTIFQHRVERMLNEELPDLDPADHDQMVIDSRYNEQNMVEVLADFAAHRRGFIDLFKSLTAEQWERYGNHPERESFSMTDALMQLGLHDVTHIEQITRTLHERRSA
jgi:hypothetical protein